MIEFDTPRASEENVRRSGVVLDDEALRLHDHALWVSTKAEDLIPLALRAVAHGLAAGEKVMLVSDNPAIHRLATEDGRVSCQAVTDVYRDPAELDPRRQYETFLAAAERASAEGYHGLRVVADNTPFAAGDSATFERWLRWEHLADRLQSRNAITGLCFVQTNRVHPARLADLAAIHPLRGAETPAPPFQLFSDSAGATKVTGEVDMFSAPQLRRLLAAADSAVGPTFDLRGCSFLDRQALAVLLDYAAASGRRLRLLNAAPIVLRLIELIGVAQQIDVVVTP